MCWRSNADRTATIAAAGHNRFISVSDNMADGMGMHECTCAEAAELQKQQKIIEFGLGVVVPSLLAIMMFSYFLYRPVLPVFFLLTVMTAVAMVIPARRISELHYQCWVKDDMPLHLTTGMLGIIYISEVSIFAVAMMSLANGFDPGQPITFAVFGGLAMALIVIMAFNDRYKPILNARDKRYFTTKHGDTQAKVLKAVENRGMKFTVSAGAGYRLHLHEHDIFISVNPMGDASEVLVERGKKAVEDDILRLEEAICC
jgi:hypothetical protein